MGANRQPLPRLPLVGKRREQVIAMVEDAAKTRPSLKTNKAA